MPQDDMVRTVEAALWLSKDRQLGEAYAAAAVAWGLPAARVAQATCREQPGCLARHVGLWLAHDIYGWSMSETARASGYTRRLVEHAWANVTRRIETEPAVAGRVAAARSLLLSLHSPNPKSQILNPKS